MKSSYPLVEFKTQDGKPLTIWHDEASETFYAKVGTDGQPVMRQALLHKVIEAAQVCFGIDVNNFRRI